MGMTLPRCVLPGRTYLISRRCLGRRFLLRPDDALSNAFVYCLALAADKHGVSVHALCAMSNHYHLVITDTDGVLPHFMAWLNRQLAMCVKRLRRWDEVVWEPNVAYSAVELEGVSEVLDKAAYVLLNPVSAALVRSPERWPGALSTVDRLRIGYMRATRPSVWFANDAPESVSLELTPPPCFADSPGYCRALDRLLQTRASLLRAELQRQGRSFLGRVRLRKTAFVARPTKKKEALGLNPVFSALTRKAWIAAVERLRAFRLAYRAAYRAWRNGDRGVEFPAGTWWVVRYAGALAVT
jgi:putative transposase